MASNKNITITVRSQTFQSKQLSNLIQTINTAKRSIEAIKEENLNLERAHDQYIIHLQQCQEDHNQLRNIFKTLKQKLDYSNHNYPPTSQIQMLAAPSVPKPLATDINKMATLENYNGIPEIQSFSESFSPSNIKLRYALNTSSHVSVIQFSSSGSKIAFADGYFLYIINSEDGEIYATLQLPTPITGNAYTYCLKFSQDDNLLAVSGPNNSIILFDVEKRTIIHTFEGHTKEVNTLIFNGNQLISSSFDSSIIVWDVKTYEVIKRLPESNNQFDSPITGMAAASGVPFFVVGFANGRIGIYDDEFVQPMISFTGHEKDVVSVAVSQFDDCIGTSSTKEPSIKIWVVRGVASLKQTLKGHSDYIQTITFSPKEPLVFTGSADKTIRLWKYKTGEQIGGIKMHNEEVCCISHHPNNKVFVSCSKDGVVCVWDYESPK